jgi:hypothetical protein
MGKLDLVALYGLKYNPFLSNISTEHLWQAPELDSFFFRVENLVMDGGFALMSGEPGLGKSKSLHFLAGRLERIGDVVVGVMERPQSTLADFYRELGDLFGVNLSPSNKYGGFKALRDKWPVPPQESAGPGQSPENPSGFSSLRSGDSLGFP